MARIILEHEDVGAFKPINSTFLKERYYELTNQGDGTLADEQRGNSRFSVDTTPELTYEAGRRRGLLFQLGTYEEDAGFDPTSGSEHKGSHTDFRSIVLSLADKTTVTLDRGKVFWVNAVDQGLKIPMNPFHALYFWPVVHFRGVPYRSWRTQPPNDDPKYARAFSDKHLHPRLRLDAGVARPSGETGPYGALLTYWNDSAPYTITAEHQTDEAWGKPWYLRYTLDTPTDLDVQVYDAPKRIMDPEMERPPSQDEILELVQKTGTTYTGVKEIRVMATPWAKGWTHGGIHDDPWTKP